MEELKTWRGNIVNKLFVLEDYERVVQADIFKRADDGGIVFGDGGETITVIPTESIYRMIVNGEMCRINCDFRSLVNSANNILLLEEKRNVK